VCCRGLTPAHSAMFGPSILTRFGSSVKQPQHALVNFSARGVPVLSCLQSTHRSHQGCSSQQGVPQHPPLFSRSPRAGVAANFAEKSSSGSSSTLQGEVGPAFYSSAPKLRVAVDVDEVLGRFLFALNEFCREKYGMDHSVSDFHVYEFAKVWMCDQDRSNKIVHEFFDSQHFQDGIPVIPGAFETLKKLGGEKGIDLVVVTSRQHVIQDHTLSWIDKHFPGIFQEVYFGNHWSLEGTSRKKSEICQAIGASALIDDNPGYALECASAGIHVLLYDWQNRYPWSKLPAGFQHPLITVVHDWDQVEEELHKLAPTLLAKSSKSECL